MSQLTINLKSVAPLANGGTFVYSDVININFLAALRPIGTLVYFKIHGATNMFN